MEFVARRNFIYGGKRRMPGEVFERGYLRNDELLIEKGYVSNADTIPTDKRVSCDTCSRQFATEGAYESHHIACKQERSEMSVSEAEQLRVEAMQAPEPRVQTVDVRQAAQLVAGARGK